MEGALPHSISQRRRLSAPRSSKPRRARRRRSAEIFPRGHHASRCGALRGILRRARGSFVMRLVSRRVGVLVTIAALAGCGSGAGSNLDSTPKKLDGTESYEFEQDDLDAAAEASDAVKEYCADTVSEAQRLGCESHVTDEDLP